MSTQNIPIEADLSHLTHDARRSLESRADRVQVFCAARGWDPDHLTPERSMAIHQDPEFRRLMRVRFG